MSTQGQNKIADTIHETGYTFATGTVQHALENQVCTGCYVQSKSDRLYSLQKLFNFNNDNESA
jgi:hypothetical protein